MPIHLELKPEVEERLGREASAKGVSVEAYVEDLIKRQVSGQSEGTHRVDMGEVDRVLDALSEGSGDLQPRRPRPTRAKASTESTTDALPR